MHKKMKNLGITTYVLTGLFIGVICKRNVSLTSPVEKLDKLTKLVYVSNYSNGIIMFKYI